MDEQRLADELSEQERIRAPLFDLVVIWRAVRRFCSWLLPVLLLANVAHAIEDICPGGSSPRGDIVKCMDFETACASDSSDLCWTDNGFSSRDDHRGTDMRILTDASKAVVGSRYALLKGIIGGTGTGYATYTLPSPQNELRIRWYQKFHQYQHYYYNHFLGITINKTGGSACTRGATLEIGGQSSVYTYSSGSCGQLPPSEALYPNQGSAPPVIKNGKYYLFEVSVKMDTSCGTPSAWNGCNGEYKLWIDGTLVTSYTNLNWGGVTNGAQIVDVQPARNYNHKRNGEKPGEVWLDQIVIGNSASTAIGAATGATNIGSAVADAYATECGIEPFYINGGASYSPELDWQPPGGGAVTVCGTAGEIWRTPSFKGSAVGTTTASVPGHITGDLIIGWAFRDGNNTAPTIPAGWNSLSSPVGTNTAGQAVAWKYAASSGETSGTWSNATSLVIAVYRYAHPTSPIGGTANGDGSSTTVAFNGLTMTDAPTPATSLIVGFAGHRSIDTSLESSPSGMSRQLLTNADATDEVVLHDTETPRNAWATTNVSVGGTSSGWRSFVLEIRGSGYAIGDSTVAHTGVVTDSNATMDFGFSRPITEQSFKTACTGANCGAGRLVPRAGGPVTGSEGDGNTNAYRLYTIPQWVTHGYIYLPSTSTPNSSIAYAGFVGDGSSYTYDNYVAISENTGKWAVIQKHNGGAPAIVATSGTNITRDTWHRYELIVWDSEGFSLMIDGVRLFTQTALTNSPTWLFDTAHNANHSGAVIGLIDYLGTGTVQANYDDVSIGSTSFWSSDGWGADSPFSAGDHVLLLMNALGEL